MFLSYSSKISVDARSNALTRDKTNLSSVLALNRERN